MPIPYMKEGMDSTGEVLCDNLAMAQCVSISWLDVKDKDKLYFL